MKNTSNHYGWITISIHWLVAVTVIGLFTLGYWMVDLGYYDPWYKDGPELHKSIGALLFITMIFRVLWRKKEIKPVPLATHSKSEKKLGNFVHSFLYISLFILMLSGYLISTADGRSIDVFNLFSIPSLGEIFSNQEDLAGTLHKYLAYTLITFIAIHAFAAIKHHFIDKDNTLVRMLGYRSHKK